MRFETLVNLVIFLGVPYILGWILKSNWSHLRFMKVLQLKAEMNQRLLERAPSDPGMLELLKSEAQQQLFDVRLADPEPPPPAPYMRMLTSLQASFLLLAAGAACLWYGGQVAPRSVDSGDGFKFLGALGVALGIGALLSAGATFVVARMWHTLNNVNKPT